MLLGERSTFRRGRQRSERSRDAILKATMELMREVGVRRLTLEGVAAAAGVGKTTLYRWWPSKGILALDAYEAGFGILTPPRMVHSSGSVREDLHHLVQPIHEVVAPSVAQRVWAEIQAEAQSDERLARVIFSRLIEPYRRMQRPFLEAAVARGELREDVDLDIFLDALYGAYYHRLLLHHDRIDSGFFEALIDLLLEGAMRPAPRRTPGQLNGNPATPRAGQRRPGG